MSQPLLEVENLAVDFRLHGQGVVRAVDGVSFQVPRGGTVALVGESGSGKSVIAQSVMRILPPPASIASGHVWLHGENGERLDTAMLDADGERMRSIRGARISMIFQEPMTPLSPLHTIGDQIGEAVLLHRRTSRAEAREQARQMLGSLTATLINSVYSPQEVLDWAWRLPFLIGGVFGLCAVYLRRMLHETPVFAELQQRKSLADELPLKTVLREHRGSVVLSMLLTWVLSAAIVVVILMTPTLLQIDGSRQMLVQASNENSFQVVFCRPTGLLNEKITTMAIGRNR